MILHLSYIYVPCLASKQRNVNMPFAFCLFIGRLLLIQNRCGHYNFAIVEDFSLV